MTGYRRFRFVVVGLLAAIMTKASGQPAEAGAFSRLGIVIRHGDEICAYLTGAPNADDALHIVIPGVPQRLALASIEGVGSFCRDQVSSGLKTFRLHLQSGTVPQLVVSVGIVGQANLLALDGKVVWRMTGDLPVIFSSCSSSEGIHLGAWQNGKRLWHAYTYIGQDLTPDCTPAQEQP